MKSILKFLITVIEYTFYRISKMYNDDIGSGGIFMGVLVWGYVIEPLFYLNDIPVVTSIDLASIILPAILGGIIGDRQKKRYERLSEKYKYEEIEPYYELLGILIWILVFGTFLLFYYFLSLRPKLP